jgi:hypothetical protein
VCCVALQTAGRPAARAAQEPSPPAEEEIDPADIPAHIDDDLKDKPLIVQIKVQRRRNEQKRIHVR